MRTIEPPPPPESADTFDLPRYDPRRTRRAIRLGMIRTAINAVVIVLVVLVVVSFLSRVIQDRSGRDTHFTNVVGTGFAVAHPDYRFDNPPACCNTDLTSMGLTVTATARTPDASGGTTTLQIHQNFLGHLTDPPSLTQTALIQQLVLLHDDGETTGTAKNKARILMASLPQRLAATAVVDFTKPLTQQAFNQMQSTLHLADNGVILLSAAGGQNGPRMLPVAWQGQRIADYQHWVAKLHNSDRGNLEDLDLNLANLRHAAQQGRIYGYIIDAAPLSSLRSAINNPAIHTIRLAQAAFDLSTSEYQRIPNK